MFKEVLLIKDIDYSNDLLLSLSFCLNLYSAIVVFGRMNIYMIYYMFLEICYAITSLTLLMLWNI